MKGENIRQFIRETGGIPGGVEEELLVQYYKEHGHLPGELTSFVEKAETLIAGCKQQYEANVLGHTVICLPHIPCPECRKAQATALDFLQEFHKELEGYGYAFEARREEITHAIEILENSNTNKYYNTLVIHSPQETTSESNTAIGGVRPVDTHIPNGAVKSQELSKDSQDNRVGSASASATEVTYNGGKAHPHYRPQTKPQDEHLDGQECGDDHLNVIAKNSLKGSLKRKDKAVDTHCPNCNNRDLSDTNLKCPHCGNRSPHTEAGAVKDAHPSNSSSIGNADMVYEKAYTSYTPYTPQTSSAGEGRVSPRTQGQPYPTPQASPADTNYITSCSACGKETEWESDGMCRGCYDEALENLTRRAVEHNG